jgi:tRNA(fMet)-specific endonuclease VapC
MLDTNILIYLIKNKPPSVAKHMNKLGVKDDVCMSFVTYAELLLGAEKSVRKSIVLQQLERLTEQVPVAYPHDALICQRYAEQCARLRGAGTPIGGNDLWIAAHALSEDAVLVTNNEAEFRRVDGLTVQNWA